MRGSPSVRGSYFTTQFSSISRNYLIQFIKLCLLLGGGLSGAFSSTTSSFLSFPAFLSSFLPPFAFFAYSLRFYSSSICLRVRRGAFSTASSYSVSASPRSFLSYIRNLLRAFLALSARPGSASSHDFRVNFYLSSCLVSLTNARVS